MPDYRSDAAVAGAKASAEDLMLGFFGLGRMTDEADALDAEYTNQHGDTPTRPAPGTHLGVIQAAQREE